MKTNDILDLASVIPVLEVTEIDDAAPLAGALSAGGLKVIEMTMRTSNALDVMVEMKKAQPDLIIGMGTVATPGDLDRALAHGADFIVTPGVYTDLIRALVESKCAALPGVATPGELMSVAAAGIETVKFFPAEQNGGVTYLKALSGPFPHIRFCPTGGIKPETAPAYLALKNVACVGGSWIATRALIADKAWDQIKVNAADAIALAAQ